jgi:phosphoserine phosphatase
MNTSKHKYQVREFIGSAYSKQLGRRLRTRTDALRMVRILKKQGRTVFATSAS